MKLVTAKRRRNYSVSEPNYNSTKFFKENLLSIELRKTQILMNKPIWYDYVKLKYDEYEKLCYMDTDSFIVHIKTEDIYKDIADDVEIRFDASNFELHRPLPKGKK